MSGAVSFLGCTAEVLGISAAEAEAVYNQIDYKRKPPAISTAKRCGPTIDFELLRVDIPAYNAESHGTQETTLHSDSRIVLCIAAFRVVYD
jgi:hypothetical protein